jgi:hypothetical protein
MKTRLGFAFALLALASVVACGESTSSDDGGGAGSAGDGTTCASDAECSVGTPKCSEIGVCIGQNSCETDADCRGDYKFCDTFHMCEPCRADADCPSETPVCVPGWEFGVYCAVCRNGDSSTCPAGTWCTPMFVATAGGGGTCEGSNCTADPNGSACLACVNETAPDCTGTGDECADVLATLEACCVAEDPTWTNDYCPTGVVPSIRGCIPETCFDEAERVDACLLGCPTVTTRCEF